jgi:signal transduction histidine kinase
MEERAALTWPRDAQGVPLPYDEVPPVRVLRGEQLRGTDAVDVLVRLPDGHEKYVQVTGAPLRDAAGTITGAVVAYHDITERKRLERERMELMGLVAHDLANPLTATKAQVQLLRRRLARQEELSAQSLDSLASAVRRMERLVADLRAMEGIEAGQLTLVLKPCDLAQLCREEAAAAGAASGRDIMLAVPDIPVLADVDPDRIGQVLGNLLSNALKYSPADRPVTLTLTTGEVPGEPAAGAAGMQGAGGDTYTRVTVHDEGTGIPPAALAHLFERFYQVLGNLLSNALKYSPADRPVTLTLTTEEVQGGQGEQTAEGEGAGGHGYVRVTVHDEGPGIPPAARSHLFERFYQVPGIKVQHGPGHSLGLGLYISRQLVERHGGHIGVDSVVGEGSTFWFTLPLAPTQP